ncbi:MAG: DUF333 domain-containing protein [Phycisphaerales bacterium]|nr:MAG: DUF333 domain-containing protein [Phycisphaerales bacterium]
MEDAIGQLGGVDRFFSGRRLRLPSPAQICRGQIGGESRIEQDDLDQLGICVLPDVTERGEWERFQRL